MWNSKTKILAAVKSNAGIITIVFFLAVVLRAIPDLLSGPCPVGFDTLQGYIPSILSLPDDSPMKTFGWAYSPFAVYLLGAIYLLTGIDPNLIMKIAGTIFYGFLGISFYFLISHGLGWNKKKSFLVTLILILEPAILRLGWDQFRQEIGLIFLFILLGVTKGNVITSIKNKTNALFILCLSLLIVFSHQLVAIIFFAVFFWQLLTHKTRREKAFLIALLMVIPSVLGFVWQMNCQFVNPVYSDHFAPLALPTGAGSFVFTNYFLSDPRFIGGDYFTILSYVVGLSLFTVIPLIPFAVKGYFKDKVFLPMLVWLIPASYSILICPWFALQMYWWWILLLPLPLTIYLGESLDKMHIFGNQSYVNRRRIFGMTLFLAGLLAVTYASSAAKVVYFNAETYMPSGLVESSVMFTDIPVIKSAIAWANQNLPTNSTLIVQEKIMGFCYLDLRPDIQIRVSPALLTLNQVIDLIPIESDREYSIWYKENLDYKSFSGTKVAEFYGIGIYKI